MAGVVWCARKVRGRPAAQNRFVKSSRFGVLGPGLVILFLVDFLISRSVIFSDVAAGFLS